MCIFIYKQFIFTDLPAVGDYSIDAETVVACDKQ